MSNYSDTIYALSTPQGKSAIALIRVSGEKALKVIKKITKIKKIIPNKTNLLFIKNNNILIDQALIIFFKSPNSFTGEDVLEINCHGSFAVIDKISKTLEENGVRLAEPGEFTKRALLNGKIDLVKTESISDLINAETEKQRELAIKNLAGGLSEFTTKINQKLSSNLASIEALIDFSDEDLPKNVLNKIKEQNKNIKEEIKKELKIAENSKPIIEGVKIGIIGKPNTGKSSFINYISKKDVSIVTNIPGTTTDSVTSTIDIKGAKFTFYDTAGLRRHKNKIEEIGIKKTKQIIEKSDLNIIFLKENEKNKYKDISNKIFVRSKSDIRKIKKTKESNINISSKTGSGIAQLLGEVYKKTFKFKISQCANLGICLNTLNFARKCARKNIVAAVRTVWASFSSKPFKKL